jgi:hypothetical protein
MRMELADGGDLQKWKNGDNGEWSSRWWGIAKGKNWGDNGDYWDN